MALMPMRVMMTWTTTSEDFIGLLHGMQKEPRSITQITIL